MDGGEAAGDRAGRPREHLSWGDPATGVEGGEAGSQGGEAGAARESGGRAPRRARAVRRAWARNPNVDEEDDEDDDDEDDVNDDRDDTEASIKRQTVGAKQSPLCCFFYCFLF